MNETARGLRASVIIPAYNSTATAAATLDSLERQTLGDFEIILIDSSPTNSLAQIAADHPRVRFHHSRERLLPHAARNVGAALARSDVLVFTDPDIVAPPDWLEKLLAAFHEHNGPVGGGVASLDSNWLQAGIHVAKFDLWLAGGKPRTVPIAPTVNLICSRRMWEKVGGFAQENEMIGDTIFCWDLVRSGETVRLAPDAFVYHDHRSTFRQLLRERFARGGDFGRLRAAREKWSASRTALHLIATVLPLRLAKLVSRSFQCSRRAGRTGEFLRIVPIVVGGHGAWLAGEAVQYCRRLRNSAS